MNGGPLFVWTFFLLSLVFEASDNRHVHLNGTTKGHPIPLKFPFTMTIPCPGMEGQLQKVYETFQKTALRNKQLDREVFTLRMGVRLLGMQLATCTSTASSITGSYQSQLLNKMNQLLEKSDSETFQILKIFALTREVNALKKKINHAANSTESSDIKALQTKHQEKLNELSAKIEQFETNHPNSAALILEIISLQHEIWDLEQEGKTNSQSDQRILDLQGQLEKKIIELRATGDAGSTMLELISVQTKIVVIQGRINVYIEKSRNSGAEYQRRWKQITDLLKKKITELNDDENNIELTQEILELQSELEQLRRSKITDKKTIESELKELRVLLDQERVKQTNLQKQMEEADYSQAQLIIKIISIMKEVRELGDDEQTQTTSNSQVTTLQSLLEEKEKEFAKAQAEITELRSKLEAQRAECSGLEERYEAVKTEFEQKIAKLNRTGDSKAALILTVINLHEDLKTLTDLISNTKDPEKIAELQRQLKEKQDELNSKTADIKRLISDPRSILKIIELQNEIRILQETAANETTAVRIKDLQKRVDVLISDIDDTADSNTKLMLRIITLQNQVEQLQSQMSNLQKLQTTQVSQIIKELDTKKEELQKYVNELNEKSQTNGRLILQVTNLQNQLRDLEQEKKHENQTSSLSITQLREQLKEKVFEHSRDQAEIRVLQTLLQAKEWEYARAQAEVRELEKRTEECSDLEKRHEVLKNELKEKIAELNKTRESNSALVLTVINLHDDLDTLRDLISTTKDPEKISELKRQLKEKQQELDAKTAEIERVIPNPQTILTIIELQREIWDLQRNTPNDTTAIQGLQDRVEGLLGEIDDKGADNTKLTLTIITLQSQVEQLQRQLQVLQDSKDSRVTQLTNDVKTKKEELQNHIKELNDKSQTNARLIMGITDLHNKLRNLTEERKNVNQTTSAAMTKLREQLKAKEEEHARDQAEIRALQEKLNQTEAECSSYENRVKELQTDLDAKMKELQSKSESVTSLALQVSTLTMQLEELQRQLKNTESETKIKALLILIEEKNNELKNKTLELKQRSAQPQRLLQIISLQTQIEKLAYVAANDTDYDKLRALQNHLNHLIEGLRDENNENTKLMFKILAGQDEIARLNQQKKNQIQAAVKKIEELESERDEIREQIKKKTDMIHTSDMTISNLSSQIMELHKKIKPLEDKIADLKETNAENTEELQKRVELANKQLQDSERLLSDADEKNFQLIMDITNLRTQLKKTQKQASKAAATAAKDTTELEQELQAQKKENRILEGTNNDLKQEIKALKVCCAEVDTHCDDLKEQLQQSQEDVDRLQQQLLDQEANLRQLQQQLDTETTEKNTLQQEIYNLRRKNEELEDKLIELQGGQTQVDDKTIIARKMTYDPTTANPRIVLSANNTEMSLTSEIQDVPDLPGRFDTALAVLGANGFSRGRNYWEVSVDGKLCYQIGMASESVKRKGLIQINPANGFWTMVLNKQGQYKAIDRRSVILPVVTQPLTLGILLNYKKGEISFYDAGTRTHLYTFVGQTFRDRIYPFVNFCVDDLDNQQPIVFRNPGSVDWMK